MDVRAHSRARRVARPAATGRYCVYEDGEGRANGGIAAVRAAPYVTALSCAIICGLVAALMDIPLWLIPLVILSAAAYGFGMMRWTVRGLETRTKKPRS